MRKSYHAAKAAKEEKDAPDTLPATPVNSPPSTDDEGEGDTDAPSSPKAAEGRGGAGEDVGLHFGPLRSVVFERKDEVSHKIDEASVEASDKGRE